MNLTTSEKEQIGAGAVVAAIGVIALILVRSQIITRPLPGMHVDWLTPATLPKATGVTLVATGLLLVVQAVLPGLLGRRSKGERAGGGAERGRADISVPMAFLGWLIVLLYVPLAQALGFAEASMLAGLALAGLFFMKPYGKPKKASIYLALGFLILVFPFLVLYVFRILLFVPLPWGPISRLLF